MHKTLFVFTKRLELEVWGGHVVYDVGHIIKLFENCFVFNSM